MCSVCENRSFKRVPVIRCKLFVGDNQIRCCRDGTCAQKIRHFVELDPLRKVWSLRESVNEEGFVCRSDDLVSQTRRIDVAMCKMAESDFALYSNDYVLQAVDRSAPLLAEEFRLERRAGAAVELTQDEILRIEHCQLVPILGSIVLIGLLSSRIIQCSFEGHFVLMIRVVIKRDVVKKYRLSTNHDERVCRRSLFRWTRRRRSGRYRPRHNQCSLHLVVNEATVVRSPTSCFGEELNCL